VRSSLKRHTEFPIGFISTGKIAVGTENHFDHMWADDGFRSWTEDERFGKFFAAANRGRPAIPVNPFELELSLFREAALGLTGETRTC